MCVGLPCHALSDRWLPKQGPAASRRKGSSLALSAQQRLLSMLAVTFAVHFNIDPQAQQASQRLRVLLPWLLLHLFHC